jgi:acyl-CoA reductase-like NAD-dependent aldehyde dehydrogenase
MNRGILKYQSLTFDMIDNLAINLEANPTVINFADNINGIVTNIPSFSTVLVSKDGDIDRAIAYIYDNAFHFAGLTRSNIKRVIVDSSIYDKFLERVSQRFSHQETLDTQIKSTHTTNQLELLLSEAIAEGADLVVGDTSFNETQSKTILKDIESKMRIYQKNFYGPVLLIAKCNFENIDELQHYVKTQPSKGILVFADKELNISSDRSIIYRNTNNTVNSVYDDFPMIDFMVKKYFQ